MTRVLTSRVTQDEFTAAASAAFDFTFDGTTTFEVPDVVVPDHGLGLIVGPSGSGKTSLLGPDPMPTWNPEQAIVSQFEDPADAVSRLMAVGLNTVPAWLRPYHALSTGEKFRADLARAIRDGARIDEFTSVIDRTVARAASVALSRYVRRNEFTVTLASCHRDIVEWLAPDWVYDTLDGSLTVGRSLRPSIDIAIYEGDRAAWPVFRPHHYLSASILASARVFTAYWDSVLIAFSSSIAMPNGNIKNAWRGHRTVVLPDFQGLGIGVRLSDYVASVHVGEGKRFFSRTAHPRMGEYREASPLWRPTSKNRRQRTDFTDAYQGKFRNYFVKTDRVAWSHEYIGGPLF